MMDLKTMNIKQLNIINIAIMLFLAILLVMVWTCKSQSNSVRHMQSLIIIICVAFVIIMNINIRNANKNKKNDNNKNIPEEINNTTSQEMQSIEESLRPKPSSFFPVTPNQGKNDELTPYSYS